MSRNAACPEILVYLALFLRAASARRWMTREHDRGDLQFYARFRRKGTKPEYYYTLADLKRDMIAHEVYRSWVAAFYWRWADAVLAGPDVHQEVLPDLTIVKGDGLFDVELDTGAMSHPRMRERFAKYVEHDRESTVLLVTTAGEERMLNLLGTAKETLDIAYATTFQKLAADPLGRVWTGTDGEELSITD